MDSRWPCVSGSGWVFAAAPLHFLLFTTHSFAHLVTHDNSPPALPSLALLVHVAARGSKHRPQSLLCLLSNST